MSLTRVLACLFVVCSICVSRACVRACSRGVGLAGRVDVEPDRYNGDSHASPVIHDLSQITRAQFNIGSPQGKTGHKFQY